MPEEQTKEIKLELSSEQYVMISEAISRSKSNTHRIDELSSKIELFMDMNKNIAVIAEQMKHTQETVNALRNDMETIKNNKKMEVIEEQMKNTQDIVVSLKEDIETIKNDKNDDVIETQMNHMKETIDSLKNDVEAIKDKPNKFLDNLKGIAAGAVITAIIGAFLALIF